MTMMLERFKKNSYNFIAKSIYMIINNKSYVLKRTLCTERICRDSIDGVNVINNSKRENKRHHGRLLTLSLGPVDGLPP